MEDILKLMKSKSIKGLQHWNQLQKIVEDKDNYVLIQLKGPQRPVFAKIHFHTRNYENLEYEIVTANNQNNIFVEGGEFPAHIAHIFLKDKENFFVNAKDKISELQRLGTINKVSAKPEIPKRIEDYIALSLAEQKGMCENKQGEKTITYFRKETNEKPFRFEIYTPKPHKFTTAILTESNRIFAPKRETINHETSDYVIIGPSKENNVPGIRPSLSKNRILFY